MNHARAETVRRDSRSSLTPAFPDRRWWDSGWLWMALAIASTIPFWWPSVPPLVDVPGHLARYRVLLDFEKSASLQQYFSIHWTLIGNLGCDLLVLPLARILGVEPAGKLVVMAIPALSTWAIYVLSREVHGRVPATALFAVPFVYNFPFNYGFTNFALAMALSLLALALWLRITRSGRWWLRAAVFAPLSFMLWVAHAFGWAVLLLAAWSAELVRRRDSGQRLILAAISAGLDCLPLCLPAVLTLLWGQSDAGQDTGGFFMIGAKVYSFAATLRDRWLIWDSFGVAIAVVLVGAAMWERHFELSRKIAIPAAVLTVVFLAMPSNIFGSAYADMRLVPFVIIFAVLAIRFVDENHRLTQLLALLGLAFFGMRLGGTTLSYAMADREMAAQIRALDYLPQGARVLSLVGNTCGDEWKMPRHFHLGSLVIVRKLGFSNDQFRYPGPHLLHIDYPEAGAYEKDPSEVAYSRKCLARTRRSKQDSAYLRAKGVTNHTADQALREFPRQAFDYVWVLRAPNFDLAAPRAGLVPIWRSGDAVLYHIERSVNSDEPGRSANQRLLTAH